MIQDKTKNSHVFTEHFCLSNVYDLLDVIAVSTGEETDHKRRAYRQKARRRNKLCPELPVQERPELHFSLAVVRKNGYYQFQFVLPIFTISAVSLTAFGIDRLELADRLSVSCTMMLVQDNRVIVNSNADQLSVPQTETGNQPCRSSPNRLQSLTRSSLTPTCRRSAILR